MLAFRHLPFEDAGLINHPVLEGCGIVIEYVDLYRGDQAPDPAKAAGLIFMGGGPMSVNDPPA